MTALIRRRQIVGFGLLMLLVMGCGRQPEGWVPILEETSTGFLRTETEAVAARIRQAKTELPANPEQAAAELALAEDGLEHLLTYYLPLLEARECAYNAYRHYEFGKSKQTADELAKIEKILIAIAESGHGHLLREMEEPLERLEDARVGLETDRDETTEALEALATRLNLLLIKGGLVLAD